MADRGPNPDLWMVTAGPYQLLKGVFYTQMFPENHEIPILKSCAFGLLKH